MTIREHGIFRFVDPPAEAAVDQCIEALNNCFYPFERCLPELQKESNGKVTVMWDELGSGVYGLYSEYRKGTYNVITMNTSIGTPSYYTTFMHEVGHMIDDTVLTDTQRSAILKKWHEDPAFPHDSAHTHEDYLGGWFVKNATYFDRPKESFGDVFVACFAPKYFAWRGFTHWSNDLATIRSIILWDISPTPTPKPVSEFPNDSVYRLYRAYFLREPDKGGYTYWRDQQRAGLPLLAVSDQFSKSAEFVNRYGALSDTGFVKLVYQNVLGRAADSGGLNHWVGVLGKGYSRGYVMLQFSESQEFINKINNERR